MLISFSLDSRRVNKKETCQGYVQCWLRQTLTTYCALHTCRNLLHFEREPCVDLWPRSSRRISTFRVKRHLDLATGWRDLAQLGLTMTFYDILVLGVVEKVHGNIRNGEESGAERPDAQIVHSYSYPRTLGRCYRPIAIRWCYDVRGITGWL